MTQRVRRAERRRKQRDGDYGFTYRRGLASFAPILRALYPAPGTPARDWPSAATVVVSVWAYDKRRPGSGVNGFDLTVRVKTCRNAQEARRRALAKLARGTVARASLRNVKPDGIPAVPKLNPVLCAEDPFVKMLKKGDW